MEYIGINLQNSDPPHEDPVDDSRFLARFCIPWADTVVAFSPNNSLIFTYNTMDYNSQYYSITILFVIIMMIPDFWQHKILTKAVS